MKLRMAAIGILFLGVSLALAQPSSPPVQGSALFARDPGLSYKSGAPADADASTNSAPGFETKNVRVSGPLAAPFKTRKVLDAPKRVLKLFNPLAPAESAPEPSPREKISPRAWTTVVGWTPGGSAFPNAETHEPNMRLLTVSRGAGQ